MRRSVKRRSVRLVGEDAIAGNPQREWARKVFSLRQANVGARRGAVHLGVGAFVVGQRSP